MRIGPPPSVRTCSPGLWLPLLTGLQNERSHLALLAETFHGVLDYKPPSMYKASAAAGATDEVYVLEMVARLGHSMSRFLRGAGPKCTPEEMLHYEALSLLCVLITLAGGTARAKPPPDVLSNVATSLRAALDSLATGPRGRGEDRGMEQATQTLASLHGVGMLRETAWAVRLASRWILDVGERRRERDRSGGGNLPRDVMVHVQALQSAAEAALREGRELVRGLAGDDGPAAGGDAAARLARWAWEGDEALRAAVGDGAAQELVDSWRRGIAGWKLVKWA